MHLRTVEFNPKETVAFTRPEAGPNDAFFLAKRQVERVPFKHAAVLELKGLETLYGMPVGAIIGFDFLSRFVIEIDYAHKWLTLHLRGHSTADVRGARVPLTMQGEQPYLGGSIRVGSETIPCWLILDVGAADTITFTTPFIAAHQLLDRADERPWPYRRRDPRRRHAAARLREPLGREKGRIHEPRIRRQHRRDDPQFRSRCTGCSKTSIRRSPS